MCDPWMTSFFRFFYLSIRFFFLSSFFPFWAAAPKGPMTYAFTQEKFLLLLLLLLLRTPPDSDPSLQAETPALRLKSQPLGPNPSLEAQILASRPKS